MNKISLTILVVAAMLMAFTSCKKDEPEPPTPPMSNNQGESTNSTNSGIYNPEKKISKIYYEDQHSEGKKLRETWTWDGDLLSKITDSGGDVTQFEYDNKRIKTVRFSYGGRMEFTYDGKKVKECNWYYDGKLDATYTFTHDGSKISEIEITVYYNGKKSMKSRKEHSLISYMMPGTKLAENVDKQLLTKATKGKGNYTYTISFEWDGDNISKATVGSYRDGDIDGTSQFTYDKKSNPYYCSLYSLIDYGPMYTCKNNVTKETYTDPGGGYEEETYTYTYDGKFPTEQKNYGEDGDYYITYYEYQ